MKLHVRFADQVVGIFVILAFVFIAALLVFLGLNQRWFSNDKHFVSEFGSASGLRSGTSITLKGIEIGKVATISLNKRNTIDMDFYVYEEYSEKVTQNSVLEMISSPIGLGGGLVLHTGYGSELAKAGSLIPSWDTPEAQALIAEDKVMVPLRDDAITRTIGNVNSLIEGINRTVNHLNLAIEGRGGGELRGIIGGIPPLIASANSIASKADGEMNDLFTDIDLLMNNLNAITTNLEATTTALKDPTGLIPKLMGDGGSVQTFFNDQNKLFNEIDAMLVNLNKTATELQAMSAGLNSEVPKIAALMFETRKAIQTTQEVMEGLRNNPLLRDGVSKKPLQESRLESLRSEEF